MRATRFALNQAQALVQQFRQASNREQRLKLAKDLYTSGSSLPRGLDRQFLGELVKNGQSNAALRIWKSKVENSIYWRSTGAALYAHTNNIVEAEALAKQGIDSFASGILARAKARRAKTLRTTCEDTASALRGRSTQFKSPAALAKALAENPHLLDDQEGVLRALSVSKGVADDEFWQQNHSDQVRDELLYQGVSPHIETALTMKRCLNLLMQALRQRDLAAAGQLYANRPRHLDNTEDGRQFLLRYYASRKNWRAVFDLVNSTPAHELSWPNWTLVWSAMAKVQPPSSLNPRELYNSMVAARGIPLRPKILLSVWKTLEKSQDYAFMLAVLKGWQKTTVKLPPQLVHHLYHQLKGRLTVEEIGVLGPRRLVRHLCADNGADFAIVEQNAKYL